MIFNKNEVRDELSLENIFDFLNEFGGDPEYTSFGIVSSTICHNVPGEGSKKLYFYKNTSLFKCYTDCDSTFDIFELVIKVMKIQKNIKFDLNDAVQWIAKKFNISGNSEVFLVDRVADWEYLINYERIQNIEIQSQHIILKEYDPIILSRFNYSLRLTPWLEEGISQEAINSSNIGFYLGGDQITIPHYDENNRFIGLRGRTVCEEEGELFGKYRPIKINGILYNHPLGMNLYNFNNSKFNIERIQKAIVFEGEKSTLLYKSYFGLENDISVACCGSSISSYQINLLINAGAKEIIIAFDRQFKEIGDQEFKRLKIKLIKLYEKYKNYVNMTFIFDKNMITNYKASPIDEGEKKFLQLFQERIIL